MCKNRHETVVCTNWILIRYWHDKKECSLTRAGGHSLHCVVFIKIIILWIHDYSIPTSWQLLFFHVRRSCASWSQDVVPTLFRRGSGVVSTWFSTWFRRYFDVVSTLFPTYFCRPQGPVLCRPSNNVRHIFKKKRLGQFLGPAQDEAAEKIDRCYFYSLSLFFMYLLHGNVGFF